MRYNKYKFEIGIFKNERTIKNNDKIFKNEKTIKNNDKIFNQNNFRKIPNVKKFVNSR